MSETTVDEYIAALDEPRRATAARLRTLVREAVPEARESVKWAQPVYDQDGPFVALKAFPKHVTLTFWRGATLAESSDPAGLLEGEGDRMRHIRFQALPDIREAEVASIVRAAAALNRELGDPTRRD